MHLIHIADTLLGLAAFNRLDPESGMNLREKQVYDNFLLAIDAIIRQKSDVLVHAGDFFDTVKPRTRAYTTVLEALDRLHAAGIPLVSTRLRTGNDYILYPIEYNLYSFRKLILILRRHRPPAPINVSGYNPSQSLKHIGL